MTFESIVEDTGRAIDAVGVAAIVVGTCAAFVAGAQRALRGNPGAYRSFRSRLGRSILLGLELLVAADIIRTVAVTPTLEHLAVLGGIVLIRTFLSLTLELETTGSWPWRRGAESNHTDEEHERLGTAHPTRDSSRAHANT